MTTIMIVDPDRVAGAQLAGKIQAETGLSGMVVSGVAEARAMSRSRSLTLAMAVIDADLPSAEGQTLCTDLVRDRPDLPVMMVGRTGNETDVVRSLRAGAVDHFAKPHHRAELLARLRAHLRSTAGSQLLELRVDGLVFYPSRRVLVDHEKQTRVWLTAKEAIILRRLHAAHGKPVFREELLRAAWGSSDRMVHTLQTHIYRLRGKLRAGGRESVLLSVPGGYLLNS